MLWPLSSGLSIIDSYQHLSPDELRVARKWKKVSQTWPGNSLASIDHSMKKKTNKAVDNEATKYESEDTGLITDRIQQD